MKKRLLSSLLTLALLLTLLPASALAEALDEPAPEVSTIGYVDPLIPASATITVKEGATPLTAREDGSFIVDKPYFTNLGDLIDYLNDPDTAGTPEKTLTLDLENVLDQSGTPFTGSFNPSEVRWKTETRKCPADTLRESSDTSVTVSYDDATTHAAAYYGVDPEEDGAIPLAEVNITYKEADDVPVYILVKGPNDTGYLEPDEDSANTYTVTGLSNDADHTVTYTAEAFDAYGEINGSPVWGDPVDSIQGVSITSNEVDGNLSIVVDADANLTVDHGENYQTFRATASYGGAETTLNIQIARAAPTASSIKFPTGGSIWTTSNSGDPSWTANGDVPAFDIDALKAALADGTIADSEKPKTTISLADAQVYDQYGGALTEQPAITWAPGGSLPTGVTLEGDTLTVTSEAVDDAVITLTGTVADTDVETTAKITLSKATAGPFYVAITDEDGSIIQQSNITIPQTSSTPATVTYGAKVYDQYGEEMRNPSVTWTSTVVHDQDKVTFSFSDTAPSIQVASNASEQTNKTLTVSVNDLAISTTIPVNIINLPKHTITFASAASVEYIHTSNGKALGPVATHAANCPCDNDNLTITYVITSNGNVLSDYGADGKVTTRNVGAATVTATIPGIDGKYGDTTADCVVTVNPKSGANLSVTGVDTSYEYRGTAHRPVPTVTDGKYTLVASTDYTVDYARDNKNVVSGGNVVINFTGNYKDKQTVTFTINKADPTVTPIPAYNNITYGTLLSDLTLPTVSGTETAGSWAWETPTDPVGSAGAQTHTAVFTPNDTYNYNIVEQNVTVNVIKSTPTLTWGAYTPSKVYDSQPVTAPTVGTDGTGNVNVTRAQVSDVYFTWYKDFVSDDNKLSGPPTDAGTYYVTAGIRGSANVNALAPVTYARPVVINKATIDVTSGSLVWSGDSFPYSGAEQTVTGLGGSTGTRTWTSSEPITTVEIPADVVKQIAEAVNDPNNNAQSLEIILSNGTSIEFDAKTLGEKAAQANGLDITITIHVPYELQDGEHPNGIIVWYVDEDGKRERCETSYDNAKKRVNWKADHLSLYMIDYDEALAANPFTDVAEDAYYYEAVLWAADSGITSGTGDGTTFSPDDPCARTQMATFLWRAAGSPEPEDSTILFTDVPANTYYTKAVQWAYEQGITSGTGDGTTFSPDATCTRGQMATFLWRNAGKTSTGAVNPFTDVAPDAYYANAVLWAYEQGITDGTSATTFSPDNTCTRAQMVTFLYRYFGK